MPSIIPDIVLEHEYHEDDRSGELTRVYRVGGLTSTSGITTDALYAVDGAFQIPRAGARHEKLPDLIVRAVDVHPAAGSKTACKVHVRYVKVRRRLLNVSFNGVTQQTNTDFDRSGNILVVGYKGLSTEGGTATAAGVPFPAPASNTAGYQYDYGKAVGAVPDAVLEITYLETAHPFTKAKKFTRKVNSATWNGGGPREWLCEAITANIESPIPTNTSALGNPQIVTGNANFDWIVTYRFRYSPKPDGTNLVPLSAPGHDPVLIFNSYDTGRPPPDIDPKAGGWPTSKKGNGWMVAEIYGAEDFADLNLVTPFY